MIRLSAFYVMRFDDKDYYATTCSNIELKKLLDTFRFTLVYSEDLTGIYDALENIARMYTHICMSNCVMTGVG